ncbi:uncharacterized protein LOC143890429 [Tasmannia lanceolata]|uniref:uncharacterized protein LOC143890429 n=1 Tax=Tasmannia lanceolata TaxID=3420 RepID=UPI004062B39F
MEDNLQADMCDGLSEEEKKDYSISELISFFKSAFRPEDFKKAEQILRFREEKLKIKEELLRRELSGRENLEIELEVYRNRCVELKEGKRKAEEDFRDLKRIAVEEEEVEKYRIRCGKLEEDITCLEEDHREKLTQEKVEGLEEELKKESDLECSKRRVVNEIEDYKRRCGELEARVLQLEEENSILRGRGVESREKIAVEPKEMLEQLDEVCYGEKGKMGSCKTSKNREGTNDVRGKEGKISNCDDINHVSFDVGSACHSPVSGSGVLHVEDPPCIITPCKSFGNAKAEKIDDSLVTNEGHERQVRKQLLFNEERSCNRKMAPTMIIDEKSMCGDVIMISDDEGEKNNMPTSKKSSKRNHSDQRIAGAVNENSSSCEENFSLYPTPKRKRASKVITSDSEEDDDDDKTPIGKLKFKKLERLSAPKVITSDSEDDDDDDVKTPIGKLKFKKFERLTERFLQPAESPLNWPHVSPSVASIGDNVEESITPSRRRLVPLKYATKITPLDHSVRENVLPKTEGVILGTTGTSYHIQEKTTIENGTEDELEDIESESEGESLGGFIVEGSSGSKSECGSADASENELDGDFDLGQVLASIRGHKDSSKWEYEADLLSSFSRDPELCMKAVCALYRQQTSEEKSFKCSLHINNRGFNKFDALKGSRVAQFLTDDDPLGPLKKSVQELEKYEPNGPEYCYQLATRYSKQLFEIYQNKEDPFFRPC